MAHDALPVPHYSARWRTMLCPTCIMRHDAVMDYEYAPLRFPPSVDRMTAAVRLAVAAEFSGWELARVRLMRDGTRQVVLRRRRSDATPATVSA